MTGSVAPEQRALKAQPGRFTLRFTLVAAFTGITLLAGLIISAATTQMVGQFVREEFRLRLADLAAVAASQVNVAQHQRLQTRADQGSPDFLAVQRQLRTIRDQGTDIRFIYTVRQQADGRVAFVVDAEEQLAAYSALGDIYADVSPELRQAFTADHGPRTATVTDHFYTDAWGTWMTAYAPLRRPDGRVEAVLAVDISAANVLKHERQYQYLIWGVCALLLALFMPLAYFLAQRLRRPLSQLEADMTQVGQFNLVATTPIRSRIIEIVHMAEQLELMKSGLRSFQKYVPADLVRRLMARGQDAEIGGSLQELTIFMSDVEGFTQLAERLGPTELVHHLSEYLNAVTGSLLDEGATVDQYIGDAVLAFWNAPEPTAHHALRACAAALDAQARIAALNRQWSSEGTSVNFKTRIGINTGEVIVGNIGSTDRMSYTIIGGQVNLVSRLEAACKLYGTDILLSQSTQQQVREAYTTRLIDQVVAYGTTLPIKVYELLGRQGEVSADKLAITATYETAFALYQQRDFQGAANLLHTNRVGKQIDPPSKVLLDRCLRYEAQPPSADWDGSFLLTSK